MNIRNAGGQPQLRVQGAESKSWDPKLAVFVSRNADDGPYSLTVQDGGVPWRYEMGSGARRP